MGVWHEGMGARIKKLSYSTEVMGRLDWTCGGRCAYRLYWELFTVYIVNIAAKTDKK